MLVPSFVELQEAYALTRSRTRETPLIDAPLLARECGAARVLVKAECVQIGGSFKIRGATWKLARLDDEQRARGVVAYSSGNFAQGLAAAGKRADVAVTIVMPVDAGDLVARSEDEGGWVGGSRCDDGDIYHGPHHLEAAELPH